MAGVAEIKRIKPAATILVVDDEKSMREFMEIMLVKEGYSVLTASSGEEGVEVFRLSNVDLIISDIKMGAMSGVDLLKQVKSIDDRVVVIMVTAYASVETAIEAMKSGAYDYLTKPFNVEDAKLHISRALEWRRTRMENTLLRKSLKKVHGFNGLIGTSPEMTALYEKIISVASTNTNVLLTGQSGTGKELTARAIHEESDRKEEPFIAINCGAIPEQLIESEIFGHEKGAFTGAVARKAGLAELANGGTLFLDEVTELPLQLQVKLLRFVQERTFKRVGGVSDIEVDIRIISASNRDVGSEVQAGRFREDLFYRLNVLHMKLPSLRERKEDLLPLISHFIEKHSVASKKEITGISADAMECLMNYGFPGNVRELENIIEGAIAVEKEGEVTVESLPDSIGNIGSPIRGSETGSTILDLPESGIKLQDKLEEVEKSLMESALKKSGGIKKRAAEMLGMTFRSFRYKAGKYGLD